MDNQQEAAMKFLSVTRENLDTEHICCALGDDKVNAERARQKKGWMKPLFDEGLVFKRLDARGKFFAETMPIENCWKPVAGHNFLMIHCLWVSGRYKGQGVGAALLEECRKEAQAAGMDGLAVISSTKVKPFLTDRRFFARHGFSVVDTAPPWFELMTLTWNDSASLPRFTEAARSGTCPDSSGWALYYTRQCPYMEEYVGLLAEHLHTKGEPCTVRRLDSAEDVRRLGSPFGTFGLYFNGQLVTHELMLPAKFDKLAGSLR
jgi:GNAT superfamily N-acetyltransferase